MRFIELHAKTDALSPAKLLYLNPDQVTALNSNPAGTLVQVGTLAYMVTEDIEEVRKLCIDYYKRELNS